MEDAEFSMAGWAPCLLRIKYPPQTAPACSTDSAVAQMLMIRCSLFSFEVHAMKAEAAPAMLPSSSGEQLCGPAEGDVNSG